MFDCEKPPASTDGPNYRGSTSRTSAATGSENTEHATESASRFAGQWTPSPRDFSQKWWVTENNHSLRSARMHEFDFHYWEWQVKRLWFVWCFISSLSVWVLPWPVRLSLSRALARCWETALQRLSRSGCPNTSVKMSCSSYWTPTRGDVRTVCLCRITLQPMAWLANVSVSLPPPGKAWPWSTMQRKSFTSWGNRTSWRAWSHSCRGLRSSSRLWKVRWPCSKQLMLYCGALCFDNCLQFSSFFFFFYSFS